MFYSWSIYIYTFQFVWTCYSIIMLVTSKLFLIRLFLYSFYSADADTFNFCVWDNYWVSFKSRQRLSSFDHFSNYIVYQRIHFCSIFFINVHYVIVLLVLLVQQLLKIFHSPLYYFLFYIINIYFTSCVRYFFLIFLCFFSKIFHLLVYVTVFYCFKFIFVCL